MNSIIGGVANPRSVQYLNEVGIIRPVKPLSCDACLFRCVFLDVYAWQAAISSFGEWIRLSLLQYRNGRNFVKLYKMWQSLELLPLRE